MARIGFGFLLGASWSIEPMVQREKSLIEKIKKLSYDGVHLDEPGKVMIDGGKYISTEKDAKAIRKAFKEAGIIATTYSYVSVDESTGSSNSQIQAEGFAVGTCETVVDVQCDTSEGGQSQNEGGEQREGQAEGAEGLGGDDGGSGEEDDESEPPKPPHRAAEGGDIGKRFPSILLVVVVLALLTILFNLTYLTIKIGTSLDVVNGKIIAALCSIVALLLTFIYKVFLWLNGDKPKKEDQIDSN
ncbi:MAG: hypothetical protein GWN67_11840 [Phycisphaerae bacterium]|nr:hypothetical protein [Phycisphaerae bacterium]NIW72813.1 hypothetical protein [candidate division KSB1 bacterium]NIP52784.1 hypothetical protein [Phycisphaerae bacterium]NIS51800.1 hypothetical protein [Phycisphaerae bacterium]NIU09329.1 hypothetical protein [Phycisphaerae bacterium]